MTVKAVDRVHEFSTFVIVCCSPTQLFISLALSFQSRHWLLNYLKLNQQENNIILL